MDKAAVSENSTNRQRPSRRRTRRITLIVAIEISGQDANRGSFNLASAATNLNRNGGSVHLSRDLSVNSVLLLKNNRGTQVPARVVAQMGVVQDRFVYGIEFLEADKASGFWGISFPTSNRG